MNDDQNLLKALLGPGTPELTCEQCFEELDRYVEGAAVPGMEAHLEGCPACREDYESLRDFTRSQDEA